MRGKWKKRNGLEAMQYQIIELNTVKGNIKYKRKEEYSRRLLQK